MSNASEGRMDYGMDDGISSEALLEAFGQRSSKVRKVIRELLSSDGQDGCESALSQLPERNSGELKAILEELATAF